MERIVLVNNRKEILTLVEDADLLIRHLPGETRRLVIAFTGIGHAMGGVQRDEFISIGSGAENNHVLFVTDRRRSWYSTAGIQESIIAEVHKLAKNLACDEILHIGNSMGGFGALLFAERIGARSAVGFVPQFTMNTAVIDETRWSQFREFMIPENLVSLDDFLHGETLTFAIFGEGSRKDVLHYQALSKIASLNTYLLDIGGHDVSKLLKARGILRASIESMLSGDIQETHDIFSPYLAERQH
jgi:hypothetical protein